jgi:hypothetical protein
MKPMLVLFSRKMGHPAAHSVLQHEVQVESRSSMEFIRTQKQWAIFWYLFT